jgi:hypothetical protein
MLTNYGHSGQFTSVSKTRPLLYTAPKLMRATHECYV